MSDSRCETANDTYHLVVAVAGKDVLVQLTDLKTGSLLCDGAYVYRASRPCAEGQIVSHGLQAATTTLADGSPRIAGKLAGLDVEHTFRLHPTRGILEEQILLHNSTAATIEVEHLALGMTLMVSDDVGHILPDLQADRLTAIPFRHRPTDPVDVDVDMGLADIVRMPGREHRANRWPRSWPRYGYMPSMQWASEGWAWSHGSRTLMIGKFNQQSMEFSVIAPEIRDAGLALRFGGAATVAEDPACVRAIGPGHTIQLGATRLEMVDGSYAEACYAFRSFLDEQGCRFPTGYSPPVHWNELYDNPEWNVKTAGQPPGRRMTRPVTYTRALIEEEARKAKDYGCEALYLDPGWDTDFGTFLWGEDWLGPRRQFIERIQNEYGLSVSLHCPLATWMSMDGRGVSSWPHASCQMSADGTVIDGAVCLGSRQYLDEAAQRLLAHCADGVGFLMFDGNWWNGGCWNPEHGHPVPYMMEDHIRANVELAQRVHERYASVLIEMHDMIAGGSIQRYTPVYYQYGLPGSYDENWGFELMWQPMEDLRSGRARSLYYYNLGCNVPLYLHIDLREDNEHCVVLWWYASTCRHLGIGGTHSRPLVAQAQQVAMKRYRQLERFYKRGEFYGMCEQVHVHVLRDENAFVVNLFNLTDETREVSGSISFAQMGLDCDRWYIAPPGTQFDQQGAMFSVRRRMLPWSAEVIEVRTVPGRQHQRGTVEHSL
jgi:hypothetical protein